MGPNLSAIASLINISCFPQNAMAIMERVNQAQNIISTNGRAEGGRFNIIFIITTTTTKTTTEIEVKRKNK